MKIKWLGHAAFLITANNGTRIITDPYTVGGGIIYKDIAEAADIVTVSHEHGDHNNVKSVKGKPEVLKGPGTKNAKGIQFKGIGVYHDEQKGSQRGEDTIFCFTVDEVKLCHLGDLGHRLSDAQVKEIGPVDVLLMPVGGFYTVDVAGAADVASKIKPRVVIPMHFKTAGCTYPINTVDDFLKGRERVKRLDASEVEFSSAKLPAATETVVLKPALA